MKTGILISARLGSTRLKRKHLLTVRERPIVSYLIERIQREFEREVARGKAGIVIATSDEPENRAFAELGIPDLKVFYGSIHNIPLRQLQAVEAHGFDHVISVDGDDILCSVSGMRQLQDALLAGASYVRTSGLPFGMNAMGYSHRFLASSLSAHQDDVLETGWGRIFDAGLLQTIDLGLTEDERLRFTLDYEDDYRLFDKVITLLGDSVGGATDQEILDLVCKEELWRLNETVCREYWRAFHEQRDQEIQGLQRKAVD